MKDLKVGDLAKKSLYVTRPGLGPHTATLQLTEEISSPLFDAIKNGLSIPINHRYALKDAADAHRDLQSRKTRLQDLQFWKFKRFLNFQSFITITVCFNNLL